MSSIIDIPNILLPNTLLNRIAWDIQWSDVTRIPGIQRRQWIGIYLFQAQ